MACLGKEWRQPHALFASTATSISRRARTLARSRRDPGLRRAVSRLERAHQRGVLRAQRRRAHRQQRERDHPHRQQLRADQLQLRAHAAELAEGERAAHLSHDPRRRAPQPQDASTATARPWRRSTTTSSCRSPTAATAHADPLGHRRLSSTASAASPKACGWPRPPSIPTRSSCWPQHGISSRSSRRMQAASRRSRQTATPTGADDAAAAAIDPTRPYLMRFDIGPSRSRSSSTTARCRARIAFEGLLNNGETSPSACSPASTDSPHRPQLVHVATDGESTATITSTARWRWPTPLRLLEDDKTVKLTNYGEFLAQFPPEYEVRDRREHLLELRPRRRALALQLRLQRRQAGWNQEWRAPLRRRSTSCATRYSPLPREKARSSSTIVWAARDDYIDVILDRLRQTVERFLRRACRARPHSPKNACARWS